MPLYSVVSFRYGLQYFESFNWANVVDYPNNHFLLLVEDLDQNPEIQTIYGKVAYHFHVEEVTDCTMEIDGTDISNPMWAEIVHEINVCNQAAYSLHKSISVNRNVLIDKFKVAKQLSKHNIWLFWTQYIPSAIIARHRRRKKAKREK